MDDLIEVYGPEITIENCILGSNLNLSVIRGFARIDVLANISAPDIFDDIDNPQGTQRDLEKKHAVEATNYAIESASLAPDVAPRSFPEVILNARDRSVVSILLSSEGDREIDFSSTDPVDSSPWVVALKIHVRQITWPQPPNNPEISRVDGNHRLSQVNLSGVEDGEEFPMIPFALFVGLSADQERALFRDINGTPKKVETAYLDSIRLKLMGTTELFKTEGGRALWLAQQLAEPGHAFEGKVFFGGSKRGPKAALGAVPPIKINTLKSAIAATIGDMPSLENEFFGGEDEDGQPTVVTEDQVNAVLILLDRYWKAVAHAFPTEWQDRTNFILLQTIGLTAFSKLAADVIKRQFFEDKKLTQSDFNKVLEHVESKVSLKREDFPGIAGLAGAKEVYKRLSRAMNSSDIEVSALKKQLVEEVSSTISPLDGTEFA